MRSGLGAVARFWVVVVAGLLGCREGARDVAAPVAEARGHMAGLSESVGDYVHIATTRRVRLALAESRGLDASRLPALVDQLAATADACLGRRALEQRSELAASATAPPLPAQDGIAVPAQQSEASRSRAALRLVISVGPGGEVTGINVRSSSEALGPTILICFVAPAKAMRFGATSSALRPGLALEALWSVSE
jgi:hypothetical protein